MLLFCVGIFTPRGSVWRAKWYNEYMPAFCMLALRVSMFVLPAINVGLSVFVMVHEGVQVAQALFALLQVGTLLWFRVSFYQNFLDMQEVFL